MSQKWAKNSISKCIMYSNIVYRWKLHSTCVSLTVSCQEISSYMLNIGWTFKCYLLFQVCRYTKKLIRLPHLLFQVKSGFMLNLIGILTVNFGINTWGYAMFDMGTFPHWANATRWGWTEMEQETEHSIVFLNPWKHKLKLNLNEKYRI